MFRRPEFLAGTAFLRKCAECGKTATGEWEIGNKNNKGQGLPARMPARRIFVYINVINSSILETNASVFEI